MTRTIGSAPFGPGTPWDLFRFEAPEDGGGGSAAVAEAYAAGETPAGEPAALAEGEPAAWAGPSQEEWAELTQRNEALTAWAMQQAQAAAAARGGHEIPRPDPFSETFQEDLDRYIEARLSPIQQTHEQMNLAAGEELAYDVIADNMAREGEFLHEGSKERAFQLARYFMPQAIQRHGYTDKAGEAALEQACQAIREWENGVGEAYHTRKMNELGTLAGARREPGTSGAGTQITTGPYARGQRVTDRFFGRG